MNDLELENQTDRVRDMLTALMREKFAPPTEAEREDARREFLASLNKTDAD